MRCSFWKTQPKLPHIESLFLSQWNIQRDSVVTTLKQLHADKKDNAHNYAIN